MNCGDILKRARKCLNNCKKRVTKFIQQQDDNVPHRQLNAEKIKKSKKLKKPQSKERKQYCMLSENNRNVYTIREEAMTSYNHDCIYMSPIRPYYATYTIDAMHCLT